MGMHHSAHRRWEASNSPVLSQLNFSKSTWSAWGGFGSRAELCVANRQFKAVYHTDCRLLLQGILAFFFLSASVWKVMCVLHMAYVHIKCKVDILWLTQLRRRKKEMRNWCFTYHTLGRCTFDRDIWFWTGCRSRCRLCGIVCGYICPWMRCKEASYGCSRTKTFIAVEINADSVKKECTWFQKGHVRM